MVKLFKKLGIKEYFYIIIVALLVFGQVYLELKMPDYMAQITRLVQTPGSQMSEIWTNGVYMLLCAFGAAVLAVISGYLVAYVTSRLSFNIREGLFNKVLFLADEDINKFSTSSLITRTTNDVTQVETFMSMGLVVFMRSPMMAIMAIIKITNKSMEWTWATVIAVSVLLVIITFLALIVVPKFKLIQKLTDKLNDVTREHLSGIRVVRAFNADKYQEDKSQKVNDELTNLQKFTQKSFAIMQPAVMTIMFGLTLAIYLIGAGMVSAAGFADRIVIFGDMVVFSSYAFQVIFAFLMLAFVIVFMSRAQVSAERINEVFDTKATILEGKFDGDTEQKGSIEFKNVSFKYPNASDYVLKDINIKVNKGETVAFIGSTGSGKSTLIKLVPRFFDATDGEILVDGVNVKDYKYKALYNKLGYVSQKAVMFNSSIKQNIAFGEAKMEITEEDIENALEISQAKDFVEKLDEKSDTIIARGGTNISGGQKQRLAIARAIARDPEIFIFDDSFSALDFKTESVLRAELDKLSKDATSLVVSSRVGSVMNADKIVVLENGRVVGQGTHKELYLNNDLYKEIALSQLSKEELNESVK